MPKIIPVRDLKDTTTISNLCHRTKGPIFITKNGYGDMVIMSMKTYEDTMGMSDVYEKIAEAEKDVDLGKVSDAHEDLKSIREVWRLS